MENNANPGTNQETPQIDLEKGMVTLKNGEDVKTFSLKNQDDLNSLIKLGQRGWYYDDTASKELGELRKVVKNWDTALEAARSDDAAMEELVFKLESALGRPLTKKEEKQMEKGQKPQILLDEEENSRLVQTIDSLMQEIETLKKSQAEFNKTNKEKELQSLQAQIEAEAERLEKKFSGKDGSPKFERSQVFEFAAQNRIEDLELAFKLMNLDKLTAFAKKQAIVEFQEQQKQRQSGFVETGDNPAQVSQPKAQKRLTYHKLGQDAMESAKNNGLNLFVKE